MESRNAWAVEIDDLEGIVRAGQQATFTVAADNIGPYLILGVEFSDHLPERTSTVALMVQASRKRGLDRFIGGTVETTDPL
ncbi:hypothetical protein [Deinococcus sp. KSM4-11]|uniref:hypothetical protein n=1 Tax=Deinococcus sp. KSM4-11 TaxID=2568654 RepID=UPI001454D652|nr:hypothetical protein [Deinococcus sp. KSM4-11]